MWKTRPVWPASQPEHPANRPMLAEAEGRPELDLALARGGLKGGLAEASGRLSST